MVCTVIFVCVNIVVVVIVVNAVVVAVFAATDHIILSCCQLRSSEAPEGYLCVALCCL